MATRIPPSLKRLNLTAIMARVRREQGWSAAEAGDAELWYRRFLQLSLERGSKPFYAITEQADHVWHAHILFTRKYRQDCERIFGGYLDHMPADKGPDSLSKERQRRAAALYLKEFAVVPPPVKVPCYVPTGPPPGPPPGPGARGAVPPARRR
jgi:hypothetical protein